MFQYRPERIIIDQAVSAEPLTEQICERFPESAETRLVENFAWHQRRDWNRSSAQSTHAGEKDSSS